MFCIRALCGVLRAASGQVRDKLGVVMATNGVTWRSSFGGPHALDRRASLAMTNKKAHDDK
jgi:hypothetical protein